MKLSPFRLLMGMYVGVIFVFSFLYILPISGSSLSYFDSLFLSASALSGTGLSTISVIDTLSSFGQWILLLEIQIGCVGIMAFFIYIVLMLGTNLSLPTMMLTSYDQNQKGIRRIRSIILGTLLITLLAELIGFIIMFPSIKSMDNVYNPVFLTMFHSVSSFANAGFDLFGESGLEQISHRPVLLLGSALLMFIGVLGFPTLLEYTRWRRRKKISLFTKTNLTVQFWLTIIGFGIILISEFSGTLSSFSWMEKITNALFFTVSTRNAGIINLPVDALSAGTFLFILIAMFIGTSSGSTGGGIRTTTFAVLMAKARSLIKGQPHTHLFKKTIPEEDVNKALLIFFGYLSMLFGSIFIISFFEPFSLRQITLEVMSALTTSGISLGITASLSTPSKIILILLMIIGRIGVIAFIYFFTKPKKTYVKYTKESMMIG